MRSVTTPAELSEHLRRTAHKLCWLHGRGHFTRRVALGHKAELTLVAGSNVDPLVIDELFNARLSPTECACRMFMEKVPSMPELLSIYADDKLYMETPHLKLLFDIFGSHLFVVDARVPYTERCTRRAANDPCRLEFAHHLARVSPVLELPEVPRKSVGPEGP